MIKDFLISWNFSGQKIFDSLTKSSSGIDHGLYVSDTTPKKVIQKEKATLIWLGDLILPEEYDDEEDYLEDLAINFNPINVLQAGGHFYCIHINNDPQKLTLLSGFCGILPIYYYTNSQNILVSSDISKVKNQLDEKVGISNRFVLEKMLFNYPIFQHTIYEDIWRVPTHHLIELARSYKIQRYFDPTTLFAQNPKPIKDSTSELSSFFRTRLRKYWPEESFAISLTGGFDGRTLAACAFNDKKEFTAYAFGSSDNPDVMIPANQARKLNIPFKSIFLDDKNYLKKAKDYGLEFVDQSAGTSDLARAHYVYGAKTLGRGNRFLLTGNFGSEIFRAMHLTGEMIAYPTYLFFSGESPEKLLEKTKNMDEYSLLNESNCKEAEKELIADLEEYTRSHDHLTLNQKLYVFLLEEVFRKYFGPEIIMQNQYLENRTPFLDFQFVKQLFSTRLAGVYSNYYEHNPVKRKKGQLFYARVIKDTHKKLYRMKTGKGYAPKDVLNLFGNIKLGWTYIMKKLRPANQPDDPFCVKKAFMEHLGEYKAIPVQPDFFNPDKRDQLMMNAGQHYKKLIKTVSLNWFINKTQS